MGKEDFWQGYRGVVLGNGVPQAKAEWFVKWARWLERFVNGLPLHLCTEGYVSGYDIRTVQEFLGHADVSPTMIYTHLLNKPGLAVKNPVDE